jgi:hypothetical protein
MTVSTWLVGNIIITILIVFAGTPVLYRECQQIKTPCEALLGLTPVFSPILPASGDFIAKAPGFASTYLPEERCRPAGKPAG